MVNYLATNAQLRRLSEKSISVSNSGGIALSVNGELRVTEKNKRAHLVIETSLTENIDASALGQTKIVAKVPDAYKPKNANGDAISAALSVFANLYVSGTAKSCSCLSGYVSQDGSIVIRVDYLPANVFIQSLRISGSWNY